MELLLGLIVGIGLSAACGCRVFVPLLVACVGARSGHLSLAHGFEWIASGPALVAFAVAAIVELAAYFVPWIDNALDALSVPAAAIAGTVLTAGLVGDVSPFLRWSLAIIAGGVVAGGISGGSALARAGSSATTGGIANPLLALLEAILSFALSIEAILLPLLALGLVAVLLIVVVRLAVKNGRARAATLHAAS